MQSSNTPPQPLRRHVTARTLLCLLALAILAAACGDDGDEGAAATTAGETATTTSSAEAIDPTDTTVAEIPLGTAGGPVVDYAGFRTLPTACGAEQPPAAADLQFTEPGDAGIDTPAPVATIVTSCGDIVVELDPAMAPESVNSFAFLAGEGYFDGTASHRIIPGFMFQAGDPTATGTGSPGYALADEFPPAGFIYDRGVVAMANAGPGTTGSQFFIMLAEGLPPDYTVIGTVVDGLDVLDAIAAIPVGPNPTTGEPSQPLESLYIEGVTVDPGE